MAWLRPEEDQARDRVDWIGTYLLPVGLALSFARTPHCSVGEKVTPGGKFAWGVFRFLCVARVADGDERRVPRPLVRIEPRTRHRVLTGPVEVEHHPGL